MSTTDTLLNEILMELRSGGAGAGGGAPSESSLKQWLQAELSIKNLGKQALDTAKGLVNLSSIAAEGGVGIGTVVSMMPKLGGVAGVVTAALTVSASIIEKNIDVYQKLSNSGVNFGGSLTQMRLSATNMYMTMDQFGDLMRKNSEAFANMGTSADDGAKSFTKVAITMQKSDVGDQLRALGYTSDQAVQGLASYIAMTGGRTKKEMENTAGLSKAAGEYMSQLDALAQITGKSREEQENAMKEASANQAYQSYLLTLDEEGRAKANAAMLEANAKGGKGAQQALMSAFLGLPPMTKAAQEFTALAPNATKANMSMANAVKDSRMQVSDIRKMGANMGVAVAADVKRMGESTKNAIIMQGGELASTVGQMAGTANQLRRQGIETEADAQAQLETIQANQRDREAAEAANFIKAQTALREFGANILTKMIPAFTWLMDVTLKAATFLMKLVTPMINFGADFIKNVIAPYFKNIFAGLDLEGMFSPFADFFRKMGNAIMGVDWKGIGSVLEESTKRIWTAISEILGPLFTKATGIITTIGNDLGPVFKDFGDIAKLIFERMADVVNLIKVYVYPLIQPIVNSLLDTLLPFWEIFKSLVKVLKSALGGDVKGTMESLQNALSRVFEVIDILAGGFAKSASIITDKILVGLGLKKEVEPIPAKALGGPVAKGQPILVGERGPELWVPPSSGIIVPNNQIPTTSRDFEETSSKLTRKEKDPSVENLKNEVQTLNKTMAEILKYIKDTADNTKRTYDATRSLNGNLFA